MKITHGRRALDKVYKRRDRYEIPDWQREKVWDTPKKKQLIDSILRGWRLPKFYFLKTDEDAYEVVDGQQRLNAIFEFFDNELGIDEESIKSFGGPYYKDLKPKFSDAFDDFEIDFDEIEQASEEELKLFFLRLQQGLPLRSSERLNAVHSKLRNFCKSLANEPFFRNSVTIADKRFAHFDIVTKAVAIEIEGLNAGLRYDELKALFETQATFSSASAIAKRLKTSLTFLHKAFPKKDALLKTRTIVQSLLTFVCRLVETGKQEGLEKNVSAFFRKFMLEYSKQVELGQAATDGDFLRFQRSVNANVKSGSRIRQEILLRKAFLFDGKIADAFDSTVIKSSGVSERCGELAGLVTNQIGALNSQYSAKHGKDLFKATSKTTQAIARMGRPIKNLEGYKAFIEDMYFVFWEGIGERLKSNEPQSFKDVNILRTGLQHDVDHGDKGKVSAKNKSIGEVFKRLSGLASPLVLDEDRFVFVQVNLLTALDTDLKGLVV